MKKLRLPLAFVLSGSAPLVLPAHDHADISTASAASDAVWLAQAKAVFPLKT